MRGRRHKLQVSTFPFLAVLLCAMGSLILVLLVMDRKAHQAAQARAQREAARLVEDAARSEAARQAEHERLQQQARKNWEQKRDALHEKLTREQIEMQLQMRKVREKLQQIAARLHYEQDTTTQLRRKVQDEKSRLEAEEQLLRTLHVNAKQNENQSKESSQALRRMTLDVLQMEQVLKDLKASRKREQKTFSVVPFHGRRGENRRPLYVECTDRGIIFHPERKEMPITALIPGTTDPANDVRAEVERRIAKQRQKLAGLPTNQEQTPYLLLLLRPGGVTTYHLFQAALKGQDLDFGYEFIDDDWVLDFPADDELPSTQPWMIATKSPPQPNPPTAAIASPSRAASNRPMGMAPQYSAGGAQVRGGRAFRGGVIGGTGNWNAGATSQTGSPGSGTGGGPAGTGSAVAGGFGGSGSGRPGGPGGPGGTGSPGVSFPIGSGGNRSEPRASASGQGGSLIASGQGGPFAASGQAGPRVSASGSDYISRGTGRGHPSAMPPSFPGGDGDAGYSGDGGPSEGGYRGIGTLALRGSFSGSGSGSGFPRDGPSGGTGSDLPGLGPPRAQSSTSGTGYPAYNTGGIAGSGSVGNGAPGNGLMGGGSAGSGNSGYAQGIGMSGPGGSVIARGNNFGDSPSLTSSTGGGFPGAGGNGVPSAFGSGGSPAGTPTNGLNPSRQGSGGSSSGGQFNGGSPGAGGIGTPSAFGSGGSPAGAPNNGLNPSGQGRGGSGSGGQFNSGGGAGGQPNAAALMPSTPGTQINNGLNPSNPSAQGPGDSPPGMPSNSGGIVGGQPGTGAPASAQGKRSSDVVIFVDPLTGKPISPPRPATPPDGAATQERPPDETDANRGPPRVRVIVGNNATSGGDAQADKTSESLNRFAPTPALARPRPRRPDALRPVWVHGGRDWTIFVECRAAELMLYPSQRTFPLAQVIGDPAGNPLLKAIQQMIERRQSARRPGEPPYHPQLCILVRPEHIRAFLTVYPALEALPIPKTRRNLEADDDVIGIVTGAVP